MQVTLELPEDIAEALGPRPESISRSALEMIAVEGYRSNLLSEAQVRRLLGFETRYEVHGLLKEHGVDLNYSDNSLEQDLTFAREFRKWSSSRTPPHSTT